jgi:hypothetical protein
MATPQDASIGYGVESTYNTGVTPTRWSEFTDEDLDWSKTIVQGKGLRVGARVARSGRRVIPTAMGAGSWTEELYSKAMGLKLQAAFGTGVSTLVAGTTFQELFTFGDTPNSLTVQKGSPEVGGTVDAQTFTGCMVDSLELNFPNADIATAKLNLDICNLVTATGYAPPSYVATPSQFHFGNLTVASGTLTPPTATALASGLTVIGDVRDAAVTIDNNLSQRFNGNGTGRKSKPTVGLRAITGKVTVEYDVTTWRDAVLNETPMNLIFTYTGAALSVGVETFQVVIPEVKFDSELPKTNGTDLITQSMAFEGLDNLVATQPIWIVIRTSDSAL